MKHINVTYYVDNSTIKLVIIFMLDTGILIENSTTILDYLHDMYAAFGESIKTELTSKNNDSIELANNIFAALFPEYLEK